MFFFSHDYFPRSVSPAHAYVIRFNRAFLGKFVPPHSPPPPSSTTLLFRFCLELCTHSPVGTFVAGKVSSWGQNARMPHEHIPPAYRFYETNPFPIKFPSNRANSFAEMFLCACPRSLCLRSHCIKINIFFFSSVI